MVEVLSCSHTQDTSFPTEVSKKEKLLYQRHWSCSASEPKSLNTTPQVHP